MAVLKCCRHIVTKRLAASSLTEVLVATTLLVLIFGIAIVTLQNVLQNTVTKNTHAIETELSQLVYQYQQRQLQVPDVLTFQKWNIRIEQVQENQTSLILFEAIHQQHQKRVIKKWIAHEKEE